MVIYSIFIVCLLLFGMNVITSFGCLLIKFDLRHLFLATCLSEWQRRRWKKL